MANKTVKQEPHAIGKCTNPVLTHLEMTTRSLRTQIHGRDATACAWGDRGSTQVMATETSLASRAAT